MHPTNLGACRTESEAPKRDPAVRVALGDLADALSYAEDRLSQLEARLTPVMSPAAPEAREEAIRKDSRCEAEQAIAFDTVRVSEIRRRIDAILDRLEV